MPELNPRNLLVSIIIPVYNPGVFLRQSIESIYSQTYTDWELIVIDDNSSEDISWVSKDYPRTKYIRQKHGGVSVARNNGILNSTGNFIAFMDQDDLWLPQKLERQVSALIQCDDAALCYCDLDIILENFDLKNSEQKKQDGEATKTNFSIELDGTIKSNCEKDLSNTHKSVIFFSSRFIVPSSILLRKSSLAFSGILDPFIPFSGDYDMIIKLGANYKIIHVPYTDVLYRKHSSNFSDHYDVGRNEIKSLIARYKFYAIAKSDHKLKKRVRSLFKRSRGMYAAQAFDRARYSLREKKYKYFFIHLIKSLTFNPLYVIKSFINNNLLNRK